MLLKTPSATSAVNDPYPSLLTPIFTSLEKVVWIMSNDQEITTDNNTKLVSYIFKKYNKNKDYVPVRNISMNIKTEKNIYKLIRLNDKQFYLLHKNSIAIFEDYWHLMYLCKDKNLIYSSFSKMYTVLKNLFGLKDLLRQALRVKNFDEFGKKVVSN